MTATMDKITPAVTSTIIDETTYYLLKEKRHQVWNLFFEKYINMGEDDDDSKFAACDTHKQLKTEIESTDISNAYVTNKDFEHSCNTEEEDDSKFAACDTHNKLKTEIESIDAYDTNRDTNKDLEHSLNTEEQDDSKFDACDTHKQLKTGIESTDISNAYDTNKDLEHSWNTEDEDFTHIDTKQNISEENANSLIKTPLKKAVENNTENEIKSRNNKQDNSGSLRKIKTYKNTNQHKDCEIDIFETDFLDSLSLYKTERLKSQLNNSKEILIIEESTLQSNLKKVKRSSRFKIHNFKINFDD